MHDVMRDECWKYSNQKATHARTLSNCDDGDDHDDDDGGGDSDEEM